MRHFPTRADLLAAESRVIASKREVSRAWTRTRVALRATLARPSSLLAAAGIGVVLGSWTARRRRRRVPIQRRAAAPSPVYLARAFLLRFGFQHLLTSLRRWRSARRRPAKTGERYEVGKRTAGATP